MFPQDFVEFLQLLIANKVEYLVVGGYAVGIHGHPRFTGDLDIWLKISDENAVKILKSVNEFGFASLGFSTEDFTTEGNIVQMGYPPMRIDILTDIDGVKFEECYAQRKTVEIDGLTIDFIGYWDLIKNKKATGRKKDEADVEDLENKNL